MKKASTMLSINLLSAAVCAASVLACVPGQYSTLPLPAGFKKQAASNEPESGDAAKKQVSTNGASNSDGQAASLPGAKPSAPPASSLTFGPGVPEADSLRKCLNLWGTTPFKEVKANQVKVMDVSVGVGGGLIAGGLAGLGNLINIGNPKDLEATSEPRLIVLPLSVNVGGSTTFELMNPNGWYCMKAAVGARSTVNIKLHCNAKIAQSDLGLSLRTNPTPMPGTPGLPVSVGVNDGRSPGSQLGIMIDSSVNLTRVDSSGNANCAP